jgi:hypothetical protein
LLAIDVAPSYIERQEFVMARVDNVQLNVRSAFARDRVHALSKLTGMTASEVIEDALRGYVPPGLPANTGKLVRRGALLVRPSTGKRISLEEANEALDRSRERDLED